MRDHHHDIPRVLAARPARMLEPQLVRDPGIRWRCPRCLSERFTDPLTVRHGAPVCARCVRLGHPDHEMVRVERALVRDNRRKGV